MQNALVESMLNNFCVDSSSDIPATPGVEPGLREEGELGQFDVAVDHDEVGHLKRCACCGAPLPQPYGEALVGRVKYCDQPPRDQVYGIDICAGLGIGFVYVCMVMLITLTSRTIGARYRRQ